MEKVQLANMCMIYNKETNQVLVQNRIKSWKGIVFPGGKLNVGEAVIPSVIREIKEETGLDICDLEFCGVKNWYDFNKEERYVVFLLKTSKFSGNLLDETDEGKVFWVDTDKIYECDLAEDFNLMLDIYLGDKKELFYEVKNNEWFTTQY